MDRARLLELVETLGREFERREMRSHLESLRLYYLAVRHRLDRGRERTARLSWDEKMTIEWFALLRLPPYQDRYPVRAREYGCGCGADAAARPSGRAGDWSHIGKGSVATEAVFPGGHKLRCNACGAQWLTLDGDTGSGPGAL